MLKSTTSTNCLCKWLLLGNDDCICFSWMPKFWLKCQFNSMQCNISIVFKWKIVDRNVRPIQEKHNFRGESDSFQFNWRGTSLHSSVWLKFLKYEHMHIAPTHTYSSNISIEKKRMRFNNRRQKKKKCALLWIKCKRKNRKWSENIVYKE